MKEEIFKDFVYDNMEYKVGNFGTIYGTRFSRPLKQRLNGDGYLEVTMGREKGKRTTFRVHRLVATLFVPNPNNYTEVNHKDYNRLNNCVENLEWVSSSQNKQHAYLKVENHISRGKKVNQYDKEGNFIKTFDSITKAAHEVGCVVSAISNCCLGRTKTAMGYQWRFVEGSTTKYERKPISSAQDSKKLDEDIV